jgi:uncharacterized membrane protein YhhN
MDIAKVSLLLPSLLVLSSAALNIRAEYWGPRYQVYLFKPLTTFLILLIALQKAGTTAPLYVPMIAAGLSCSLVGDVFLMLPGDRFLAGLGSFMGAHLCYIVAFSAGASFVSRPWLIVPWLAYALILFRTLLPHVGKLKWPVLVYGTVIVLMAWRALERWVQVGQVGALLAALGAVLFVISDSALALNRFKAKFRSAQALVLSTYFAAQWLIALST